MTEDTGGLGAAPTTRVRSHRSKVLFFGAIVIAILVTLVWINVPALLGLAGHLWAVSDPLEPADAAVVLGGGPDLRPHAAAELYKAGRVRQILLPTIGPSNPGGAEPDNLDRDTLIKLGIPRTAIREFGNTPSNTYQEARDLAVWAKENQAQRIIVPTEIFPSRRVRWIFRRELGKVGVHVMIETLAPHDYDTDHWWQSETGPSDFRTEIIKYLYYRIRYLRS
jgi:uncharacterized SAM-binding protein YcdF (DUF218 family)